MTAYSYTKWNELSRTEKGMAPAGISIGRNHVLNNPDRGAYWTGQSAALALAINLQEKLTSEDREEANRWFGIVKGVHRTAVNADSTSFDRHMTRKTDDANRALTSSDFVLTDRQFDELYSATDDINRIIVESEIHGLQSDRVLGLMIARAASAAVGFAKPRADQDPPEFREYLSSPEGKVSQANLYQSVSQLYARIKDEDSEYIDALDVALGENTSKEDREKDRDMLENIVRSVPFSNSTFDDRNVDPEKNFSIRMDTVEEAKMMETILRWAAKTEELPSPEVVNEVFNSWHDSGLVASPFEKRDILRIGVIAGNGQSSNDVVRDILEVDAGQPMGLPTQYLVLATDNRGFALENEIGGRPVIQAKPIATRDGVEIEGLKDAPKDAIIVLNMTHDEAKDPTKRSIATNAFVGSAYSISYIEGGEMSPMEAQAIHLAGSMRKLAYAQRSNGEQFPRVFDRSITEPKRDANGNLMREPVKQIVNNNGEALFNEDGSPKMEVDGKLILEKRDIYKHPLDALREKARQIDAANDPSRYYAAGIGRPREGVSAVVFDGARNYSAAIYKHAKGKDVIGDAFSRIPETSVILSLDNEQNSINRFLRENAAEAGKKIFYAEASRVYSYSKNVGGSREREDFYETEKTTELKIFKTDRSMRQGNGLDEEVQWNSPDLKGAIVMVRGNAMPGAGDVRTQETKIAQEAMIDYAHTGVIFDDMQKDYHGATLIRLANEMGKRFTVFNKEGESVPLSEARDITRGNSQSVTEQRDVTIRKMMNGDGESLGLGRVHNRNFSYALHEPVAQMALKALPGMNEKTAAELAKLPLTLEELYKNNDKETLKVLNENGMKGETLQKLGDMKVWQDALGYGLSQEKEAEFVYARFVPASPLRREEGGENNVVPPHRSAYVFGDNIEKPVMAFIGNANPIGPKKNGAYQSPEEMIDTEQLSKAMKVAVEKGFAIGVTLEEGVGLAVLKEAAKIPEAQVLVSAPSNYRAASEEVRKALGALIIEDRVQVVMPTSIAPNFTTDKNGEEVTVYSENRNIMSENLAYASKAAVVVQAANRDMVIETIDKMNRQDKPIMVMIPKDIEIATSDAYQGNLKLARGSGTLAYQTSSNSTLGGGGWSNISEEDTNFELVNGIRRGNAGTFESIKERNDAMFSSLRENDVTWGKAAQIISDERSMEKLFDKAKEGDLEPLGQKREKTVRELEKIFVARHEANSEVQDMFAEQQRKYASSVEQSAAASFQY